MNSAAICAISSNFGPSGAICAKASRNIVLQNGQAAPKSERPCHSCSARSMLTRLPSSSPRNTLPPPAPQQNERSRVRSGSYDRGRALDTSRGSSYNRDIAPGNRDRETRPWLDLPVLPAAD